MSIPMSAIAGTVEALLRSGARKAIKYVDAKHVVKATRRFKQRKGEHLTDIVLTIGAPNHEERAVIRRGSPKHVVLKDWPVRP